MGVIAFALAATATWLSPSLHFSSLMSNLYSNEDLMFLREMLHSESETQSRATPFDHARPGASPRIKRLLPNPTSTFAVIVVTVALGLAAFFVFTAFEATAFLTAGFFTVFAATFLVATFFTATFLVATFFTATFLVGTFLAATFLIATFFVVFLAAVLVTFFIRFIFLFVTLGLSKTLQLQNMKSLNRQLIASFSPITMLMFHCEGGEVFTSSGDGSIPWNGLEMSLNFDDEVAFLGRQKNGS